MWTMIAVYQDHSFDKPFNIALDIIFWTNYVQVYIGSRPSSESQQWNHINHSANPGNSYETLESTTLVANLVGILVMELVL